MHYTVIPAADELPLQLAASFSLYKALDHVITAHAYKSFQRDRGSVCLGHLSAPPRTNILCAKLAYIRGLIRKLDELHSTRRIIKVYTLKIIQMPLRGTVAQFYCWKFL